MDFGLSPEQVQFQDTLRRFLAERCPTSRVRSIMEDAGGHDPALWDGKVLFSGPERQALRHLMDIGLHDTFRLFDQAERQYTWWDYRMNAFRRKLGLRIDHILASDEMRSACRSCRIDVEPRRRERPSDHAPVVADFAR